MSKFYIKSADTRLLISRPCRITALAEFMYRIVNPGDEDFVSRKEASVRFYRACGKNIEINSRGFSSSQVDFVISSDSAFTTALTALNNMNRLIE